MMEGKEHVATSLDEVPLTAARTEAEEERWLRTYKVNRFRVLAWYSALMQLLLALISLGVFIFLEVMISRQRAETNARAEAADVIFGVLCVLGLLMGVAGLVALKRKNPILVTATAGFWTGLAVIAFVMCICVFVFWKNILYVCTDFGSLSCVLMSLFFSYCWPLFLVLVLVTFPLLFFHLRHSYDLRNAALPPSPAAAAEAGAATGSANAPTGDEELTEEQEAAFVESYRVARYRVLCWYSTVMQVVVSLLLLALNGLFIANPWHGDNDTADSARGGAMMFLWFTVPTLLVSALGVVGMWKKKSVLVTICGVYWVVIALLLIGFLSWALAYAIASTDCVELGCVFRLWGFMLVIPLLYILLTVTCPMLYFHLRHAWDLRSDVRRRFAIALRTRRADVDL